LFTITFSFSNLGNNLTDGLHHCTNYKPNLYAIEQKINLQLKLTKVISK
jgi:hypothetical protein